MPEKISAPASVPQSVVEASLESSILIAQAASNWIAAPSAILMKPIAESSTS